MWSEPLILRVNALHYSNEEFFRFCAKNRDLKFERNSNEEVIIMPPTGFESGVRNSCIIGQLYNWNRARQDGEVTDSSTGFVLKNTAIRAPDAAWISHERLSKLTLEQKRQFLNACPEFIVELKFPTDAISTLQTKMEEWIQNGVQLGWLIDVDDRKVYVYEAQQGFKLHLNFEVPLSAEPVLEGFELNLIELCKETR